MTGVGIAITPMMRPAPPERSTVRSHAPVTVESAPSRLGPERTAVRVWPRTAAERADVFAHAIDVWSEHSDAEALDVVLDPAGMAWVLDARLEAEVLVVDIDALAEDERERLAMAEVARPPAPGRWFSEYRDLSAIHAHLDQLAQRRPDLVMQETIGHSLEGRPLVALRIGGTGSRRAGMLINGGLHAREWISMMVTTCVADRLISSYDDDARIRRFVDEVELWVVPVSNPDGYVHSWSRDRYWRKNRRDGHGVDLNRNFDLAWGGPGSSDKPASQIYRGTAAFSEPESAALRDLMHRGDFDAHIDFHSYGQLLLHPWSHKRKRSRDHKRLSATADGMAKAIAAQHGKRYRKMSGESLYPASGTFMDWAYGEHEVSSFVIELRPRGGSGFVLPPEQIVPTCDEGLAAVLTLGESVGR